MTWLPEANSCALLRTGTSVEFSRTAGATHCAHIHGERAHQSVLACCWACPTFASCRTSSVALCKSHPSIARCSGRPVLAAHFRWQHVSNTGASEPERVIGSVFVPCAGLQHWLCAGSNCVRPDARADRRRRAWRKFLLPAAAFLCEPCHASPLLLHLQETQLICEICA